MESLDLLFAKEDEFDVHQNRMDAKVDMST